jgi:hypothetical protein
METGDTNSLKASGPERRSEPAKLVSLLALATGAVAMPQGAEADIIYENLGAGVHVGFASTNSPDHYTFVGLPGGVQFGLTARAQYKYVTASHSKLYKSINLALMTTALHAKAHVQTSPIVGWASRHFAQPLAKGAVQSASAFSLRNSAALAVSESLGHEPASYDHQYIAWSFTPSNSIPFYGWIELSVTNSGNGLPDATLFGYAWDNTGAKITMGETPTPEPSSPALLALGALALGARGIRKWRRERGR